MNAHHAQIQRRAALAAALAFLWLPQSLFACATCYGKSDSKLAEGLNIGIFALLGFITLVMLWIAGFFYYLARRAGTEPADGPAESIANPPNASLS